MIDYLQSMPETSMRSTDRILKLQRKEGEQAKRVSGVLDTRLFSGEQKLHLKMDPQTSLWSFHYEFAGNLPPELNGKTYTTFSKGFEHATRYFETRNIKITEVKD